MAFKLLTRGGIYLVFIVVVIGQWLFRRMKTNNQNIASETEDAYQIDDPILSLSNQDWHIRLAAIQMLANNPELGHIPDLINSLDDAVYDIRKAASEALIAHGEAVIDPIVEYLKTANLEAREMIVEVLASLPVKKSKSALEHLLLHDESAWVRIPAAEALGEIGDPSVVQTLIKALADDHQDVYNTVVVTLNEIGTLEGIQAIAEHPYQASEEKKKGKFSSDNDLIMLS